MAHTSEYEIEDIFIDRLEGIGYKFIKLNNYDEVLANFREQLAKFNAKKLEEKGHTASFSDSEFNRIMIHVDNHSVYESAKVLRDKYDLQLDNGESVYIEFFSGDTDRNIYQVTHQVTMDKAHKDDVVYKNRYDVTVLINGLPLVQIELKRPGVEINEAINQINRYRKFSFKGIFRYLQLFVVSNSVQTKYFCNENEMLDGQYNPILKSLVFFWTDEKNTRINDLNTFTGEFFRKSAITEMLRFKTDEGIEFPNCKRMKMKDIFVEIIDKKHPTMPVLSVQQGMGTILRDKSNRNINYNKTNLDSYKAMKKGDFIIHLRSFEGGLECSNYDGISSPAYKILRTNKLIPEAYKGYFRTYNFIEGKLSAAVVGIRDGKNIDMPTFWEIELNVPSLPEQQKIAEFLSTVDRVIEKQKETITTWKERKKGVMQKLFSQEVRFKANDGSEFPEWEEKKIDDIATCFAGATPSTKIPEYWDNGTIQWMSSGEVNNGQIYETEKRISQLGFDKCSTKMVKPNTVVMALAGQGKTRGMVAITRVPLCTNQSLCAIETNDDICDDYLYQYLQTQYNNLRLISSGDGTRGGLNLKLVGGYVVSMPCFIEQQKIVACLSALDDVIEKKKATLAAWEELKKGLLQQMFV